MDTYVAIAAQEGMKVLGWRDVPTDNSTLGESVKPTEPVHKQVFLARSPETRSEQDFERRLYILRKTISSTLYGRARAAPFPLLPGVDLVPHADLQGHVPRRSAQHLLSGSARSGLRERARADAPALLDQHVPDLVARASLPHDRPQRRDQHAARQQQLDGGAAGVGVVAEVRRRHQQAVADLLRRPVRHGLLRQRARIPDHGRLSARPRDDDDDTRGVGGQSADERGAPRLLRIQRRADGAVGRPGRDRLHQRPADRRDARPQRAAPGALHRHPRRSHHHGLGGRGAADPGRGHRHQVAAAAGQDAAGRPRRRPAHSRRGAQGDTGTQPPLSGVARPHADSSRGAAGGPGGRADLQPGTAQSPAGLRLHPGGSETPDDADGDDRRRGGRLHGQRHADLGTVGQTEAPVHLLQAELRAGHQPADRSDPRGAGDEPRLHHRPAAESVRPRRHVEHQAAGGAPADPHQCGPGENPLDLRCRRVRISSR